MADAVTTNYSWSYPTNGADATSWGTTLNTTLIAIDAQVRANVLASVPSASPTFSGVVTSTGNIVASAGAQLVVTASAGSSRYLTFQTATAPRWTISTNGATESGSNVGSDLVITRWNDAGSAIDIPFVFTRSTGNATFGYNLTVSGTISGNLTGNVSGNVTGSSGSCTGNAATASTATTATSATTATTATNLSGGSVSATTFTASGAMTKGSAGGIPYLVAGTDTGGAITISTLAPSGTPANGDVWLQHA